MKRLTNACGIAFVLTTSLAATANAELIYGVTQTGFLTSWDSGTPGTIAAGVAIQGLQTNEKIVGLDLRPATGELYGLGSFSRLYKIDRMTGVATQVGPQLAPTLNGTSFGFDFNPTVDRIRVVSDADQNLRLHPVTGAVVGNDGTLQYGPSDPFFGANPNVVHSAYTNNFAGATTTTLYGIDASTDSLVIQSPPNNGTLLTIGSIGADMTDVGGFDISGLTGIAYAVIQDAQSAKSTFWKINLVTGQGSFLGEIGGGAVITAMTVPAPGAFALLGLAGMGARRRRRD
ncbi:MAG: DUF4394 domain-containing protein [Phycisphaerae bacterium]|nr:DUF4394 domain-containing protein [Phycisphaerae bacterium]